MQLPGGAGRPSTSRGLVGLLADDALLTMPPEAARAAIGESFGTLPLGGDLTRIRLVPARATGRQAVGAYAQHGIVGSPHVHRPELFERLGLSGELPA